MAETETRVCRYCHTEYPMTDEYFVAAKGCYHGLSHRCKRCRSEGSKVKDVMRNRYENSVNREYMQLLYLRVNRALKEDEDVLAAKERREQWEKSHQQSAPGQRRPLVSTGERRTG